MLECWQDRYSLFNFLLLLHKCLIIFLKKKRIKQRKTETDKLVIWTQLWQISFHCWNMRGELRLVFVKRIVSCYVLFKLSKLVLHDYCSLLIWNVFSFLPLGSSILKPNFDLWLILGKSVRFQFFVPVVDSVPTHLLTPIFPLMWDISSEWSHAPT